MALLALASLGSSRGEPRWRHVELGALRALWSCEMSLELAAPPLTYVSWGCRRCGFAGGVAHTTFPLESNWTEEMGRALFGDLRRKLIIVHQRHRGCIAAPDDFTFGRYVPPGKQVVGIV